MTKENPYDQRYSGDELYWGRKPSTLCDRLLEFDAPDAKRQPTLIDLGAGEGRNAIFLAQQGYAVTALDLSPQGIVKARQMAAEAGVKLEAVVDDICDCSLGDTFDVVFSTGTFHYIPPEIRSERVEYFKQHTTTAGIHAISVLVQKPFIAEAPDHEADVQLFKSGELLSYYWDWEIRFSVEEIFDCNSGGIPHRHAVNRMIARQPQATDGH